MYCNSHFELVLVKNFPYFFLNKRVAKEPPNGKWLPPPMNTSNTLGISASEDSIPMFKATLQ